MEAETNGNSYVSLYSLIQRTHNDKGLPLQVTLGHTHCSGPPGSVLQRRASRVA